MAFSVLFFLVSKSLLKKGLTIWCFEKVCFIFAVLELKTGIVNYGLF